MGFVSLTCPPHIIAAVGHGLTPSSFCICSAAHRDCRSIISNVTRPARRSTGGPGLPGPRAPDRQLLATFLDLLTLAVLLPFLAQRSPYSLIENLAGGHEQHAAGEAGIAEMRGA